MNLAKKGLVVGFLSLMLASAVLCKAANAIVMPSVPITVVPTMEAQIDNGFQDNGDPDLSQLTPLTVYNISFDSISLVQSDAFFTFNVTNFIPNSSATLELYGSPVGITPSTPSIDAFYSDSLQNVTSPFTWSQQPAQLSATTITPQITNSIPGPAAPELYSFNIPNVSQYETQIGGQEYLSFGVEQPTGSNFGVKLYGADYDSSGNFYLSNNTMYNVSPELTGTSTPTPEPSSLILGFLSLAGLSRFKRKK